ncbi:MAG TPA: hypothetical protein VHA73_07020 [Acidimicrobiales bacterium]|jgi:hypothetical protein|nr:hypothetical protein [Acidimicrobiales bacterium]
MVDPPTEPSLRAWAVDVLGTNDRAGWTRPSASLYPHQWSWDAAFCAVGWATVDVDRALAELEHLLAAQWSDGRVPHIVYDPSVPSGAYEPGPDRWGLTRPAGTSPTPTRIGPPAGSTTSPLVQPAVHAIALLRVWDRAAGRGDLTADVVARVATLWPKLAAWHRYLHTRRDPDGTGLVTIWHPWESGLDNSPRWDAALAHLPTEASRAEPTERRGDDDGDDGDSGAGSRPRPDTAVVDADQRPSAADYDRYWLLIERGRAAGWSDDALAATHPFRVGDVLSTALLAAADDALGALAVRLADHPGGYQVADHDTLLALAADADRGRAALDGCWDVDAGLCLDRDLRTGEPLRARTIAGFAPLIAGGLLDWSRELLTLLDGPSFCGAPGLRWRTPPSTAVDDPAFDPRNYWRGPTWPVMTWLFWWALRRGGHHERAARLRAAALDQLAATGLSEYVEPRTGEPLGSPDQSWTAAVALDWLAG